MRKLPILLTIFLSSLILLANAEEPEPDPENTCIDSSKYLVCNNISCPCPDLNNKNAYFDVLRVVSPSFTLILILGYLLAKNLRQQPGDFFLGFALGEMALFIISNLESYENSKPKNVYGINTPESFCFAIGSARILFRRAIRLYHICFMIYYLQSLKSSLKASKVSTTLYHVIPWLTASCLLLIEINKGTVGKAVLGTCGLRSSAEPGRFTVDLILCVICIIVTGLLISRFSSRYRSLGPATKKQIRYYLSYFIFANVFLFIPFISKAYSSYKLNDYFNPFSARNSS